MNQHALPTNGTPASLVIAFTLWGLAAACIGMQLLIGAALNIAALDFAGITIALFVFSRIGASNAGGWLLLVFVFGNTLLALFIKTLLLQRIDINLVAPFSAYKIEFLGILALCTALVTAAKINFGRPTLEPELITHNLRVLAWGSLVVGAIGWHFNRASPQIGGFSVLRDLLFMAVICKTAMLAQSEPAKKLDAELTVIITIGIFLGLIDNSKAYMALPLISYYVTLIFFEQKISPVMLILSAIAGLLFIEVISPLLHVVRFLGIQHVGGWQRLHIIEEALSYAANGHFEDLAKQAAGLFGSGYYDYFGSNAPWSIIADRYASIQQIDPIAAKVAANGPVNFPLIADALENIIPHLINSTKLPYPLSYYLLYALGFVSSTSGKYPTLPMLGELDAVNGPLVMTFAAFLIFLSYFIVLKKISWDMRRNVFAIFFLLHFVLVYANQGEVEQYLNETLRQMPTFGVIFIVIKFIGQPRRPNPFVERTAA